MTGASGYYLSGAFVFEADSWQGGLISALWNISGDTFGVALGINDNGLIVGGCWGPSTSSHAVLWQDGAAIDLGTLGGIMSEATAVNDQGQVVGDGDTSSGVDEAFLWQNGIMTNLGALPGAITPAAGVATSAAYAINNSGQVVGHSLTYGNINHAFLWQNGTMTDLGVLSAGSASYADAINNQGQVVGYNTTASGVTHAFLWQNGRMADLGTLAGYSYSKAQSINSAGIIVGEVGSSSLYHAVLWQNGTIIDLNGLLPANSGWVLTDANSINDNDQVVGIGTHNGVSAPFQLTLNGSSLVSSMTAANFAQVFQNGLLTSPVAVTDSAANVSLKMDVLQSAAAAHDLSSIVLTDSGTPTLTVGVSALTSDASALGKISSGYNLSVAGTSAANAASVATQAHVASVDVFDWAANVRGNIDALQSLVAAGKLAHIVLIDSGATLSVSTTQLTGIM